MNTYHINEHDEVVPSSGGRVSNDTRSYRDATELELSQREEIAELESKVSELEGKLGDSDMDGLACPKCLGDADPVKRVECVSCNWRSAKY